MQIIGKNSLDCRTFAEALDKLGIRYTQTDLGHFGAENYSRYEYQRDGKEHRIAYEATGWYAGDAYEANSIVMHERLEDESPENLRKLFEQEF